jgi:hypothetical protein
MLKARIDYTVNVEIEEGGPNNLGPTLHSRVDNNESTKNADAIP